MNRRRFNVFALMSLSLCVAMVFGSWALSFWIPHHLQVGSRRTYGIRCDCGTIQLRFERMTDVRPDAEGKLSIVEVGLDSGKASWSPNRPVPPIHLSPWRPLQSADFLAGGELPRADGTYLDYGYHLQVWGVAHWMVATVLTALLASQLWRRKVLARLASHGLCPWCGYDLRATPDCCPECGAVPAVTT